MLVILLAWAAHEITSFMDLSYASAHREISPTEQRVHDYLIALPLVALSIIVILHWQAFLSLMGLGEQSPDWRLSLKVLPAPLSYLLPLIAVMSVIVVLFVGELYFGIRARRTNSLPGIWLEYGNEGAAEGGERSKD